MPLLHIVILALVQGITEFLPISSSGHLVLVHAWMGVTADDLMLDIAVHVGTLFAVLVYFRVDIFRMIGALRPGAENRGLLYALLVGSVPVIIAGFIMHMTGMEWTRSLALLGWSTLIFGIILWAADKYAPADKTLTELSLKQAFLIGLAQVIALIPGVSRSGITMTAGRALGFSRTESAHFSLLLATIAISGAGALGGLDVIKQGDMTLGFDVLVAIVLSFLSSWGVIIVMMRFLSKGGFTPFALYRVFLGIILLYLYYTGALDNIPVP